MPKMSSEVSVNCAPPEDAKMLQAGSEPQVPVAAPVQHGAGVSQVPDVLAVQHPQGTPAAVQLELNEAAPAAVHLPLSSTKPRLPAAAVPAFAAVLLSHRGTQVPIPGLMQHVYGVPFPVHAEFACWKSESSDWM
jgi:hypothetical protein